MFILSGFNMSVNHMEKEGNRQCDAMYSLSLDLQAKSSIGISTSTSLTRIVLHLGFKNLHNAASVSSAFSFLFLVSYFLVMKTLGSMIKPSYISPPLLPSQQTPSTSTNNT